MSTQEKYELLAVDTNHGATVEFLRPRKFELVTVTGHIVGAVVAGGELYRGEKKQASAPPEFIKFPQWFSMTGAERRAVATSAVERYPGIIIWVEAACDAKVEICTPLPFELKLLGPEVEVLHTGTIRARCQKASNHADTTHECGHFKW